MGDVFVGIVEGQSPNTVTVGIVQDNGQRITGNSFVIEPANLRDYYISETDGRFRYEMPVDLFGFGRFMNNTVPPNSHVKCLIEVPEAVPHPRGEISAVPHPVLPADSVILKILVLLGVNEIVKAPFKIDSQFRTAIFFPILRGGEMAHLRERSPRYLPRGVCRAYGELLGLTCERAEHVAIVAALIAKNPGAFHFWSSIGRVQSSQDVLNDLSHLDNLRRATRRDTRVYAASETYITEFTNSTVHDRIEDVPLEYAVAEQRYQHLGPNNAIKAGLIEVCRQWRIDLRCSSMRADADEPDTEYPVYPLATSDWIVIAALQHAEGERIWDKPT